MCVSVCLCEKVCQWISYERVDRFGWKLRCMLQLASNREPPLTSTMGPLFPTNLGRGWFLQLFEPLYLENQKEVSKNRRPCRREIWRSANLILYIFFLISLTVFEIFWKNWFWKKLSGAGGRKNVLTWVKLRFSFFPSFFLLLLGIESPLDSTVVAMFPQN